MKKPAKDKKKEVSSDNQKAHWAAYRGLQKQVDEAWKMLKSHIDQRANFDLIAKDHNRLLLLLGECNYMTREWKRIGRNFQ